MGIPGALVLATMTWAAQLAFVMVSAAFATGCTFPSRSDAFACRVDDDCDGDRTCEQGFCVIGDRVDAGNRPTVDASPDTTRQPDAFIDPFDAIKPMCIAAGYVEDTTTGGFYKRVANGRQWAAAQQDCKDDVPSATHLLVLSSPGEGTSTFLQGKGGWIGLSDIAAENTFVTVTGETPLAGLFANGQPDNGGGDENCVEITSGKLNDDQCDNNHSYTCECDGRLSTP